MHTEAKKGDTAKADDIETINMGNLILEIERLVKKLWLDCFYGIIDVDVIVLIIVLKKRNITNDK